MQVTTHLCASILLQTYLAFFSYGQALSMPRILHSVNRTFHRAADSVWDDINRNPPGLLPGGQRTHLSPVREARHEPAALCTHLPTAPDAELTRLLPLEEDRRAMAMGDGIVRRHLCGSHRDLPLYNTTRRGRAIVGVVDCPFDAMAGCLIGFPECVPDDHPQVEVLSEVWHLEPCDHDLLRVLRGALHIRWELASSAIRPPWKCSLT